MTELLFDTPWWLPVAFAGLGIYLFWIGNRRQESRVRRAGIGAIVAAVALLAISYFVDTHLETAVKRSKQMVHAVEQRDWPTLNTILAPGASLSVFEFVELYGNRKELIDAATDAVDRYGIKNVRVLSTTAEQSDTLITITLLLMSEQDVTQGRPLTTSWKFEWQRSGGAWALEHITCLKIGDLTGERAARQFPRPR